MMNRAFARYLAWRSQGDNTLRGRGAAFKNITSRAKTINFELQGLNISEALAGDASKWVGRYTAWELQQITKSPELFKKTTFFLDGAKQTPEQLKTLGIVAPN
ncbi:MAG: hypothetical protein RL222_561 [Bacteroidota bacterium]|jgi:3-methyladenine DNA glycosylase AlkD